MTKNVVGLPENDLPNNMRQASFLRNTSIFNLMLDENKKGKISFNQYFSPSKAQCVYWNTLEIKSVYNIKHIRIALIF